MKLENVQRGIDNNTESVFFTYNDTKVSFFIMFRFHDEFNANEMYHRYVVCDDITAYYWEDEVLSRYMDVILIDDTYYSISAKDESSLLYILDNLKES